MANSGLTCEHLDISVDGRVLVRQLSLDIAPGSFVCLLGTNGVGKTLTLHTLAGLRQQSSGTVRLNGDQLSDLSRKSIARRLGLLLQIHEDAFPLTVRDAIQMGNYARLGMWQWHEPAADKLLSLALDRFDLHGFDDRLLATLSGGERERVALATLMVQDPDIWLLDEPMNHLDPQHQLDVLRTLRDTAADNRVVLASMHNPAMAMRFADFALLLYGDGNWEYGATTDLLEPDRLSRMFNTPFKYFTNGDQKVLLPA